MSQNRSIRGKVAVAGVGETPYYKHGQSPDPEFKMALQAILNACADAGIDPREIDGFCSYSNDRNEPSRLAAALGLPDLKYASMQWGGGGGGGSAAVGTAMADCIVVFRALAQGQFQRFGAAAPAKTVSGDNAFTAPYGVMSPGQRYAMKAMRFMHEHRIERSALRAISMASYHHAQRNPRAVMHGRPLTEEKYDASRWIDLPQPPVYLLGAAQGSEYRNAAPSHNAPTYASSSFTTVAPRLYAAAGVTPQEVDVVQNYENFTGGVLMSLVEHELFKAEEANEFLRLENLVAPDGKMPLNTSGGNLAECYMHGLELQIEAIRQVRGQSTAQAPNVDVSLVCSGPMVTPVSSCIFGSEATL
jgi:acetyl-CoA acetyltransferase